MPVVRADLSPVIVHLTKNGYGADARTNLIEILSECRLEARSAFGVGEVKLRRLGLDDEFVECQRVVGFTETPLDQLPSHLDPGVWRTYEFKPYGVAFPRRYMLDKGANQVWYLNSYPGGFRWRVLDVNELIEEAVANDDGEPDPSAWENSYIARLTPFMEVVGEWEKSWGTKRKDFAFEREWRYQGDFEFSFTDLSAIIVPPGESEAVGNELEDRGIPRGWIDSTSFLELDEDEIIGGPDDG